MKKHFSARVKLLLILAVLLAVVTAVTAALSGGTTWGHKAVQTALTPLRSGVSALTRQVERFYNYVFNYEALEAENIYLKQRITSMEDEVRTADSLQRENRRLEELLGLSEENEDYSYCAAYVVSWDSSNWKSTFTINKGSSAGLTMDMVVVTEFQQVIGLITDIGPNWATVTTVLDSSLEVSASIASSGNTGVVQGAYTDGQAGKLRMNYLPSDAVLRNNDQVVTTGSTVYPKDLILGYVEDAGFDETGVAKYAVLTPAADFSSLEQVFIITEYKTN
ncbi:MAG: rod shape-determining protein MreC [Oscillospiraceae bacterium]|nr:rod shape-determining protein MreC [Oscillospiraceae bacterium]